jgi:hypothetical protein
MRKRLAIVLLLMSIQASAFLVMIPLVQAVSWTNNIQRTDDPSSSDFSPFLTQTRDGRIWLLWHRSPLQEYQDIYYETYNGTWSTEKKLTTASGHDMNPSMIQTDNGKLWLFWTSNRLNITEQNYKLFYKTSVNNGATWSKETQLTNTSFSDRRPAAISTRDGKVWVFWHSKRLGTYDIYYKVYDGQFWSADIQLTFDPSQDWEPSALQSRDGAIWVFWSSNRTSTDSDYEIFYKKSQDNGNSWSTETRITTDSKWDEMSSCFQAVDGKIWIAWQKCINDQTNDWDIYYKIYDGTTWGLDTELVGANDGDINPSIFQAANKSVWLAWASNPGGYDFDLFYKVTLPYSHDVGISKVTVTRDIVFRGFETTLKINASVWNFGLNTENFQVIAYYNSTIIGSYTFSLYPNSNVTKQFTLNTLSLSLGYYVIKVRASTVYGEIDTADNTYEYGVITLTYPGDANADRIVDIADVAEVNYHWYDPPFYYSLNYDEKADFNSDGRINIYDSSLINLYSYKSW